METSDEEETPDALNPANALPVLVIQVSRVYDALMALLRVQSPEVYKNLWEGHQSGRIFSPAPYYVMEENNDDLDS